MNKITLEIIKQFKEAYRYRRDVNNDDYELYFNGENVEEPNSFDWLYISSLQEIKLIGFKDGFVYAIDTDGYLIEVCEGLENIPYEILRIESESAENELVQDLFNYDKDFETNLVLYEKWCKENKIELDTQKVYHDENGSLFTKYFEK